MLHRRVPALSVVKLVRERRGSHVVWPRTPAQPSHWNGHPRLSLETRLKIPGRSSEPRVKFSRKAKVCCAHYPPRITHAGFPLPSTLPLVLTTDIVSITLRVF